MITLTGELYKPDMSGERFVATLRREAARLRDYLAKGRQPASKPLTIIVPSKTLQETWDFVSGENYMQSPLVT